MKKKLALLLILLIASYSSNAQDGYTFSLVKNSTYNFSVQAVANYDKTGPDLESFGFAIMLQDGASIDQSSLVLPYGSLEGNTMPINSAATLNAADPGNDRSSSYIAIGSGSGLNFPDHVAGDAITIATFDVLGNPTSGEISILDNGSALAVAASNTLNSFFNVPPLPTNESFQGLATTSSFPFMVLSTETNELAGTSIYPNPVSDVLNIKGLETELTSVSIYTINGQKALTQTSNLDRINTSGLAQGVYFVELRSANATKTLKIVKN